MTTSELQLDLGTVTMNCTTEEVAATLSALLGEMRGVIPRLREDERDVLRQIMSRDSAALVVADVFPNFVRESEGHKTLRRLRAAQFIRPARTGRWDAKEPIEVKPFARLMWDHVGEDSIFDGISPVAVAAPAEEIDLAVMPAAESEAEDEPVDQDQPVVAAQAVEEEVVDLGNVEEEGEAQKPAPSGKKAGAASFEDDNVLDDGDLDELYAYAEEELRGKRR